MFDSNKYNESDRQVENIVNSHSDDVRRVNVETAERLSKLTDNYEKAYQISLIKQRETTKLRKQERLKKEFRRAFIGCLAACAVFASGKVVKDYINENPIAASVPFEVRDEVEQKIYDYEKMMGINAERKSVQFEVPTGDRDVHTGDAIVYYQIPAFVKAIEDASLISGEEVRCVIKAGYNLVNEGYKQKTLDDTFERLKDDENISDEYTFLKGGSLDAYLHSLGYEDLNEYNKGEARNIAASLVATNVNKNGVGKSNG